MQRVGFGLPWIDTKRDWAGLASRLGRAPVVPIGVAVTADAPGEAASAMLAASKFGKTLTDLGCEPVPVVTIASGASDRASHTTAVPRLLARILNQYDLPIVVIVGDRPNHHDWGTAVADVVANVSACVRVREAFGAPARIVAPAVVPGSPHPCSSVAWQRAPRLRERLMPWEQWATAIGEGAASVGADGVALWVAGAPHSLLDANEPSNDTNRTPEGAHRGTRAYRDVATAIANGWSQACDDEPRLVVAHLAPDAGMGESAWASYPKGWLLAAMNELRAGPFAHAIDEVVVGTRRPVTPLETDLSHDIDEVLARWT